MARPFKTDTETVASFIRFTPAEQRAPVERLAAKLGRLRGGKNANPAHLNATVIEAVLAYERVIDRELRAIL